MDNQTSQEDPTKGIKRQRFEDVDVETYIKYIEQAEELITRGYVGGVSTLALAKRLWEKA